MSYDPSVKKKSRDNGLRMDSLQAVMLSGLSTSGNIGAQGGHPLAALIALEEMFGEISFRRARRALRGYATAAIERNKDVRGLEPAGDARLDSRLGIELPLSEAAFEEMMEEVRRFQWIEAERAGKNIWRESSHQDPEAAAFTEWFRRHFAEWYLARRGAKAPAQAR